MLRRLALRKAVLRSPKQSTGKLLRTMSLHTTGVVRKDEKDPTEGVPIPTQGILDQIGLSD
ncbi:hypothetical protein PsorP6_006267 [Peronosclerospora sorghi]|uniref:Uncharacterized protein n=1 Tax=Peronosclerospora sorghi TaxID=230839 RepID=A0ACC0W2P5_9STRA|nr:hypothetical protein PsorP6_006267 [Peronosclerospora sorghi]